MDQSVLKHIGRLVEEEHRLFGRGSLSEADGQRLAVLQLELDRCWDLLRQRRARREFGDDPSLAQLRDAEVVRRYLG